MADVSFSPADIAAAIAENRAGGGGPAKPRGPDGKFAKGDLAKDAAEPAQAEGDPDPAANGHDPDPGEDTEELAPETDAAEAAPEADAEPAPDAPKEDTAGDDDKKPVPAKTWAAVFRREKLARDREHQSRQAITQAQAARQEAENARQEARALLEQLKSDPYTFVEKHAGFDFDQWAKRRLAGGKPEPLDETAKLRAELQAMREETTQREQQAAQKAQEAAQTQQVQTWLEALPAVLDDPKYELIKLWGAADEVPALAGIELRRSGKWLTQTQAADKILSQLELHLGRLEKAGKIRKADPEKAKPQAETRAARPPQVDDGPEEELVIRERKRVRPMTRDEQIAHLVKKHLGG